MADKWVRIKSGDERESQSYDESFRLHKGAPYGFDSANNTMVQLGVNSDGMLRLVTPLSIANGQVAGHSSVNKYGRAMNGIQLTNTDVWDRADATPTQQIWLAPTAPRVHAIVSTSDADSDTGGAVAQGQGARTIRIWGLKTWDTAETSEDKVLDGTTSVNTANSYVIIHRMKVLSSGTSGPNVGNITATAATDSTVTAQISIAQGQTNMAVYGIPSTQTAYLNVWACNHHNTGNPTSVIETDFSLLVNEFPDTQPTVFINKANMGLLTTGSTTFDREFNPPKPISGPAIIKVQAISTLADTEAVSEFDMILVDN